MNIPVITIDGPTASGKGTIGKLLAEKLGWHFLDSGAIYRVFALAALQNGILAKDHDDLENLATNLVFELIDKPGQNQQVILNGIDVTHAIRQEDCGIFASEIAVLPKVRAALLNCQRRFRVAPGLVADGRDMGTLVFPDATFKIFLTALAKTRAERRFQQLQSVGISANLSLVQLELEERDNRDEKRIIAPLKPAENAVIIDTTYLSIHDVVTKIMALL